MMKSQYPEKLLEFLDCEPLASLQNYIRLRQISPEKVATLKSEAEENLRKGESSTLNKEEDDSLASFFYTQSFTLIQSD